MYGHDGWMDMSRLEWSGPRQHQCRQVQVCCVNLVGQGGHVGRCIRCVMSHQMVKEINGISEVMGQENNMGQGQGFVKWHGLEAYA